MRVTSSRRTAPLTDTQTPALEPFATLPVAGVVAVLFALFLSLSGRYGFHRDELYFLDTARHLQGGYVDQPAFVAVLARISIWLFGVSLVSLRIWSALGVSATVVVGALIARELGGKRAAQIVAAIGVATMPALLAAGDLFETSSFDPLFWSLFAWVVIRVGRTRDPHWWLLGGLVLGLGLTNKHSIGFFAAAVVAGAVLSGDWRLFVNRWALAGAIIAACFTLPDLIWQAQHNWPTILMTQTLNQENGGAGNISNWLIGQLFMVNAAFIWVWIVGLIHLWRARVPLYRSLVWAFAILFVLFMVTTGAKDYYIAPAYVYLLAAGAVHLQGSWSGRRIKVGLQAAATAVFLVIALPLALPVLPPQDIGGFIKVNPALSEQLGWPKLVHTVRGVWFSLPPAQRRTAVILASNYGEAGALHELGARDLPVVSGHNNEWFWGPGRRNVTTVVAVEPGPVDLTAPQASAYLKQFFSQCSVAATLRNRYGIHNQEWGGHVYVCTGLHHSWLTMWPQLRQYS